MEEMYAASRAAFGKQADFKLKKLQPAGPLVWLKSHRLHDPPSSHGLTGLTPHARPFPGVF